MLVADEQSLFREAVRVALQNQPDVEVVAEASDGVRAVADAERTRPDVAIIDANLPNCDGIRATALLRTAAPNCRVLVLGNEDDDLRTLVSALEAGAKGFITRAAPLDELIAATRAVHQGDTFVPSRMLGNLLDWLMRRREEQGEALRRAAQLTRREREVLALLAEGGNNDAIAQALVISPQTARTHIQNVLAKLGVHSRLEAAAFVRKNELVDELSSNGQ